MSEESKKRMDEVCQKTFLDELTLMVETGEVNHKDFLQWLHSYIAEKYLEPFLAENVGAPVTREIFLAQVSTSMA